MANAGSVKGANGRVFRSNERQIIMNVFHYSTIKHPEKNVR